VATRRAKRTTKSAGSADKRVLQEIGARVRRARLCAALTQEEAAARAGIDYKRWQRLEQGLVNPTARTLVRVAEAVRTDLWQLMSTASTPPKPEE
jgi:transcriptional regulator with XRE-family HTH domain